MISGISSILRHRFAVLTGFICGALLGSASAAIAGTSYSGWGYTGTVNGRTYKTRSIMYTVPTMTKDEAETTIFTISGANVAAGWIAANGRKFKNGALCSQTGYEFNASAADGLGALTWGGCGAGVYYSYGTIAAWNGSGYNYYYSPKSPSLNG